MVRHNHIFLLRALSLRHWHKVGAFVVRWRKLFVFGKMKVCLCLLLLSTALTYSTAGLLRTKRKNGGKGTSIRWCFFLIFTYLYFIYMSHLFPFVFILPPPPPSPPPKKNRENVWVLKSKLPLSFALFLLKPEFNIVVYYRVWSTPWLIDRRLGW